MVPTHRLPTHPGEVLEEEFLRPLEKTQVDLAHHLGIPVQRVNELCRGKRGITPDTALLLSKALNTTPEFWMNLQRNFDLARARHKSNRKVSPLEALTA
jgi:addiction module HigA family antidote